jgi:hypothetical protein
MRSPLRSAARADCTTGWVMRTVGRAHAGRGSVRPVVRGTRGVTDSSGYSGQSAKKYCLWGWREFGGHPVV